MKKFVLTLAIVSWGAVSVWAQFNISTDPTKFTGDIKSVMVGAKNPDCVKVGEDFETVWNAGAFSDKNKKSIIDMAQTINKRKYKVNPQFLTYFRTMADLGQFYGRTATLVDSFLFVTQKILDRNDPNGFTKYLQTCDNIFLNSALYFTTYNSLKYTAPKLSFGFATAKSEDEVVKIDTTKKKETTDEWSSWDKPKTEDDWGNAFVQEKPQTKEQAVVFSAPEPKMPSISGPYVKFGSVDLFIRTIYDSTSIKGTKGTFMFDNNLFVGEGGKFDWTPAGFAPGEVTCTMKKYFFNVTLPQLDADIVTLSYPTKLDSTIKGSFQYKSIKRAPNSKAKYPRFKSFSNNISVKSIGKDIVYKGGFSLEGKRITSSSYMEGKSSIEAKGKFTAISNEFEFRDSILYSKIASVLIPMDKDSLMHAGISFTYNPGKKEIKLIKDEGSFKNAPFRDTYHKLEIEGDMLRYDLVANKIDIQILNGRSQIPAKFSSFEFYDPEKYSQLQGILRFHPLQMVIGYSRNKKSSQFYLDDLANDNKLNPQTVRSAMTELMKLGFVDFVPSTGYIKIRPKAFHYFISKNGKKDFDNISIKSISENKPNCTLDMKSKDLIVRGVQRFYLSDSMGVYVDPDSSGEVRFLKNRDILFNGRMNAGRFQFKGKRFRFDYDSFMVDMQEIDELDFNLDRKGQNLDLYGKQEVKKKRLGIELESARGILYINKPTNKNGRAKFPEFPIFSAKTGGLVMFDKKNILDGAYDRSIFFRIPPFEVDSLNSDEEQAIAFDGFFVSGGIFPEFKERLVVMPDQSLGFEHRAPAEGYPLYGKKNARFHNKLTLNYSGLRGNGELEYLSTKLFSDDIVFYKDSLIAAANSGTVDEADINKIHFPDVTMSATEAKFFPRKDSLSLVSTAEPFELYHNNVIVTGALSVSPKGLKGEGTLDYDKTTTFSDRISFLDNKIQTRESVVEIKSENPTKPALVSKNVKGVFDIAAKTIEVSPEIEGSLSNEFPYSQYKTSIGQLKVDLKAQKVFMKKPKETDIKKSYFFSTHPQQDSLKFSANQAVYDMKEYTLVASGVPFIYVGDMKVFADSNKVTIKENANMLPFHHAKILIDSTNKYFNLYNGKIQVLSRKKIEGTAMYDYQVSAKQKSKVKFSEYVYKEYTGKRKRKAAKEFHTVATANIDQNDTFYIAEKILYKGKMTMYAHLKDFEFDGFVKMDFKNIKLDAWIPFKKEADSTKIAIDFNNPKSDSGQVLYCGLHFVSDTIGFYPTFFSAKNQPSDKDIISGKGKLIFTQEDNFYKVGDSKKIQNQGYEGGYVGYNDKNKKRNFSGKLALYSDAKELPVVFSGQGTLNPDSNTFRAKTMLYTNLGIPSGLYGLMGEGLAKEAMDQMALEAEPDKEKLYHKIGPIIGEKATQDYKKTEDVNHKALCEFSREVGNNLVISSLALEWVEAEKAFVSKGKISVLNAGRKEVNAQMNGFIELKKSPQGDILQIYINPQDAIWYYIKIEGNHVKLLSHDPNFNAAAQKGKIAPGKYYYTMSEPSERVEFVKHYYRTYLGKEIELQETVDVAPEAPAMDTPLDTPTETPAEAPAETPSKSKKKDKKAKEEQPASEEAPIEDPVMAPASTEPADASDPTAAPASEKKKKEKPAKKKAEPVTPSTSETQPENKADAPATESTEPGTTTPEKQKKDKKKKSKDSTSDTNSETAPTPASETAPAQETAPAEPAAEPAPQEKPKKKKKEEMPSGF